MVVLVTGTNDEYPIKNEGARVATILYIDFQTLHGSSLCSQWWDLAEIRTHPCFLHVLVACKQGQLVKGAECHIYLYCFTFVYIDLNRAFVIIV